jgi:hypothetical protein
MTREADAKRRAVNHKCSLCANIGGTRERGARAGADTPKEEEPGDRRNEGVQGHVRVSVSASATEKEMGAVSGERRGFTTGHSHRTRD